MKKSKWRYPTRTKTYYAWRNMRRRCIDPKDDSYKDYGGRGITVCRRWLNSYDNFFEDMGECPPKHSLERMNNNKGYSPSNCKWATMKDQLNNQRRNVVIKQNGLSKTVSQWAEHIGIRADTLFRRLKRMSVEKAFQIIIRKQARCGTRYMYEKGCKCQLCKDAHAKRFREIRARKLAL